MSDGAVSPVVGFSTTGAYSMAIGSGVFVCSAPKAEGDKCFAVVCSLGDGKRDGVESKRPVGANLHILVRASVLVYSATDGSS